MVLGALTSYTESPTHGGSHMGEFIINSWVLVFNSWVFIAQVVLLIWPFRPKSRFRKYDWGQSQGPKKWAAFIIAISAASGFVVMTSHGYQAFFHFVPFSWGGVVSEFGEWESTRTILSYIMGVVVGLMLFSLLVLRNEDRRKRLNEEDQQGRPDS